MKLTNEKIEEIRRLCVQNRMYSLDAGNTQTICQELLELRRLSGVSGGLEKRIEEKANLFSGNNEEHIKQWGTSTSVQRSRNDKRYGFEQGAHFVIPIIRAESKAEIESLIKLQNDEQEFFQKRDKEQRDKIASLTEQVSKQSESILELMQMDAEHHRRAFDAEEENKIMEEALKLIYRRRMSVYLDLDAMITDKLDIAYQALCKLESLRSQRRSRS